ARHLHSVLVLSCQGHAPENEHHSYDQHQSQCDSSHDTSSRVDGALCLKHAKHAPTSSRGFLCVTRKVMPARPTAKARNISHDTTAPSHLASQRCEAQVHCETAQRPQSGLCLNN